MNNNMKNILLFIIILSFLGVAQSIAPSSAQEKGNEEKNELNPIIKREMLPQNTITSKKSVSRAMFLSSCFPYFGHKYNNKIFFAYFYTLSTTCIVPGFILIGNSAYQTGMKLTQTGPGQFTMYATYDRKKEMLIPGIGLVIYGFTSYVVNIFHAALYAHRFNRGILKHPPKNREEFIKFRQNKKYYEEWKKLGVKDKDDWYKFKQSEMTMEQWKSKKSVTGAILLATFLPGAGHYYNRKGAMGLFYTLSALCFPTAGIISSVSNTDYALTWSTVLASYAMLSYAPNIVHAGIYTYRYNKGTLKRPPENYLFKNVTFIPSYDLKKKKTGLSFVCSF